MKIIYIEDDTEDFELLEDLLEGKHKLKHLRTMPAKYEDCDLIIKDFFVTNADISTSVPEVIELLSWDKPVIILTGSNLDDVARYFKPSENLSILSKHDFMEVKSIEQTLNLIEYKKLNSIKYNLSSFWTQVKENWFFILLALAILTGLMR